MALWRERTWKKVPKPYYCCNLYSSHKGDWELRVQNITAKVKEILDEADATHVYCEMPEFFNVAGGHLAANTGDLGKLTFLVGAYAQAAWSRGAVFVPITPREWKGQTSKEQVIRKIRQVMTLDADIKPVSHSWDAIGIGLWAQGLYRR